MTLDADVLKEAEALRRQAVLTVEAMAKLDDKIHEMVELLKGLPMREVRIALNLGTSTLALKFLDGWQLVIEDNNGQEQEIPDCPLLDAAVSDKAAAVGKFKGLLTFLREKLKAETDELKSLSKLEEE